MKKQNKKLLIAAIAALVYLLTVYIAANYIIAYKSCYMEAYYDGRSDMYNQAITGIEQARNALNQIHIPLEEGWTEEDYPVPDGEDSAYYSEEDLEEIWGSEERWN